MHFQHFYQYDATHVRTLILKDRKKYKKVDSKSIVNRPIQFPNKHRACFFRILKNRCVKRPRLLRMCPPSPSQKVIIIRTNKQTNNRRDRFFNLFWSVRTDVKSASRNNAYLINFEKKNLIMIFCLSDKNKLIMPVQDLRRSFPQLMVRTKQKNPRTNFHVRDEVDSRKCSFYKAEICPDKKTWKRNYFLLAIIQSI